MFGLGNQMSLRKLHRMNCNGKDARLDWLPVMRLHRHPTLPPPFVESTIVCLLFCRGQRHENWSIPTTSLYARGTPKWSWRSLGVGRSDDSGVMRVRDVANRTSCQNNLRQVGIALANYESANGRLPPGSSFRSPHGGEFGTTWLVKVLPFLEASNAYQQISALKPRALNDPFLDVNPNPATASVISGLLCPSDGLGGKVSQAAGGTWSHSNYLAYIGIHGYGMENLEGAFGSDTGRTMAEFLDGTSNTLAVGEYLTGVPQSEACKRFGGVFWLDRPGSAS